MPVTVIDSSIALQWVLPEEGRERSFQYVKREGVVSADILLVETANVLAKKVRAKQLPAEVAIASLELVRVGVLRLVNSQPLILRALELSIALSHPVYDCVFLACAEAEGGRLATRDAPFIKRATERDFGHLLEIAP